MLAKVTVVKIANYGTSVCGDVAAYTGSVVVVVVCMLRCSEVVVYGSIHCRMLRRIENICLSIRLIYHHHHHHHHHLLLLR